MHVHGATDAPPASAAWAPSRAGMPSRLVTLHRSSHGVVVQLVRVVLLVVCVAVLGQNLATMHHWSTQTWVVSALLALYVVGAFVELARSFAAHRHLARRRRPRDLRAHPAPPPAVDRAGTRWPMWR